MKKEYIDYIKQSNHILKIKYTESEPYSAFWLREFN